MSKRKILKRTIIIISSVLIVLIGLTVGGAFVLINYALSPEMTSQEETLKYFKERYPQINPWLDSLEANNSVRDTFIMSGEGTRLHAYFVPAPVKTKHTAVIIHGYGNTHINMLHIGYMYHDALKYNIILPDLRYAGLSEGKAIQMGWKDREDILKWIDAAPAMFGDSLHIAVHGISMGGATTMMVSGEPLPESVKLFVDDCGYTSVWDQFGKELKERFCLPTFPVLNMASWICDIKYGWNFKEASAIGQIKKCRLPMLFIHGDKDDFVPTWMVYDLYEAKPEPKELWVSANVTHANSYKTYPEEYTSRVKDFTEKYIDK